MAALSFPNELESQLKKVGKKLSMPPRSIRKILRILDKAEGLLSDLEQTPSDLMMEALLSSMGALISDSLLKHPDVDVQVSVASCIREIIRITAPKEPYNDEIMKKVFQLNVMAFGKLSHGSGRCYSKALHILNSMAHVQSYFLMMDLEFEDLIAEMFQQFLSTIRSTHPNDVFTDMERIMTKIVEESEEVSDKLLSFLLSSVSKENQNVSPISWKLGEKVLKNCTGKLQAYLPGMMQSLSLDPDNYAEVVASICQDVQSMNYAQALSPNQEAEGLMKDLHSPVENSQSVEKSSLPSRETDTKRKKIPNKRLLDYVIGEGTEFEARNRKKEDVDHLSEASKKTSVSPKVKEQNADPPCLPAQKEDKHSTEAEESKGKSGKKRKIGQRKE